jgi:hypothetical protein
MRELHGDRERDEPGVGRVTEMAAEKHQHRAEPLSPS